MEKTQYFSVECRFCHQRIPLIECDDNFNYKVPEDFLVVHKTQDPRAQCDTPHKYHWHKVARRDFERILEFNPHSDFEKLREKR
jgi:hypothetical protein